MRAVSCATGSIKTNISLFNKVKAEPISANGKPFGQALGHSTGDPPSFCYPYMWSNGAMEVDKDGKTILFGAMVGHPGNHLGHLPASTRQTGDFFLVFPISFHR
jgi:hypothetical protein